MEDEERPGEKGRKKLRGLKRKREAGRRKNKGKKR